jgi:chaperone required for assembly of F1-ATPase
MGGWKAKRFWKTATVQECPGGFEVRLDGRAVKTPAKAALILPTGALAQAVAAEWDTQTGEVRPATMPMTRYANSAIDKVSHQFDEVVEIVAAYGGSDLICYRAPGPEALTQRQAAGWDPLLDWSAQVLGAPLVATVGIVPVDQPAHSLAQLRALAAGQSAFHLAGLHDLVAITGSLIIGLGVQRGHLNAEAGFAASRIDERYQAEVWGRDEAAAEIEARKASDLSLAAQFLQSLG